MGSDGAGPTAHAFRDDALGADDATTLAEKIQVGELDAVEVARAAIRRARDTDERLRAIECDDFDGALARAVASPRSRGPFAGVPTFIKDMIDMAGLPTRYGSEAFEAAPPAPKHDPLVAQFVDMGMVLLGKSTMPELGFIPSTEFPQRAPTRNPWNTERTAGGSSGGAAALVAAGVVPIAHTADGGGSTRIPAACCGLVGLKPTHGRLRRSASTAHQIVPIVADGVVTRSVRDTVAYYQAAESLFRNPDLPPIGRIERPLRRRLRIAMSTETPGPGNVDTATRREFERTAELLRSLGHDAREVELPANEQFVEDFTVYWSMLAFAVHKAGHVVLHPSCDRRRFSDLTRGLAARFKRNARKAPGAIYRLRKLATDYARFMQDYDVVLTPTLGQVPPSLGYMGMDLPYDTTFPRVERWVCFTPYANATGAPAISLPLGFDEESHTPVGMMFGARHGDDRLLLELALELERAQPFRRIDAAQSA